MPYDKDNPFAKILRGEIACKKIKESTHALAFHDATPQAPHHILIIPKGEYQDYADFIQNASTDEITDFFKLIHEVATLQGLDSYRLLSNLGKDAHQTVMHFHFHCVGGRFLGELLP